MFVLRDFDDLLTTNPGNESKIYGRANDQILDTIAGNRMIGTLQQIKLLSQYGSELFSAVFQIGSGFQKRISALNDNLSKIEAYTPELEKIFNDKDASYFLSTKTCKKMEKNTTYITSIFRS